MSGYPPSAGQCDRCGYFKTWSRRVPNPKTGKQMPAHIDAQGNLLNGDGLCPYYQNQGQKQAAQQGYPLAQQFDAMTTGGARPQTFTPIAKPAPVPEVPKTLEHVRALQGTVVNGFKAVIERLDYIKTAVEQILTFWNTGGGSGDMPIWGALDDIRGKLDIAFSNAQDQAEEIEGKCEVYEAPEDDPKPVDF